MAVGTALSAIEGSIDDRISFHLDAENDVLYLRKTQFRNVRTFGEETPDGFTLLRTDAGELAGITVVNYWRDFGEGTVDSASMRLIREQIGVWANRHFNQ